MTGRIVQLNRSPGGVPKLPIPEVWIGTLGLEGDGHNHPKHHGGPERAVSLFALEVIEALRAEGHPIAPGSTGENVTVSGLPWATIISGTKLQLGGDVVIEITRPATPCKLIAGSFADRDSDRISHKLHPGDSRLYARVLQEGRVRVGDPINVLDA
ncbi:MAG: MOSC domain-containing protein [Kofleriaceae bacterium]